ncbi:hypothetical protein AOLI_G00102490 [Acnodon oligacanthus]
MLPISDGHTLTVAAVATRAAVAMVTGRSHGAAPVAIVTGTTSCAGWRMSRGFSRALPAPSGKAAVSDRGVALGKGVPSNDAAVSEKGVAYGEDMASSDSVMWDKGVASGKAMYSGDAVVLVWPLVRAWLQVVLCSRIRAWPPVMV